MFNIAKILLPIDFSARSTDAADAAAAVAERFGSEIVLLHVLAPGLNLPLPTSAQLRVLHGLAREEAEEKMKEFRSNEWRHLGVKRVLQEGRPGNEDCGVCQFGTRRLDHDAHSWVWSVSTPAHRFGHGKGPPRCKLSGLDGSSYAGHGVWHNGTTPPHCLCRRSWAAKQQHPGLGEPAVLGVWRTAQRDSRRCLARSPYCKTTVLSPEWRGYVINRPKPNSDGCWKTGGVNGEIHIEVGSIAGGVADVAKEVRADLLVIGRNSHDSIAGRLPTNAYAIIRESPCPVLSV